MYSPSKEEKKKFRGNKNIYEIPFDTCATNGNVSCLNAKKLCGRDDYFNSLRKREENNSLTSVHSKTANHDISWDGSVYHYLVGTNNNEVIPNDNASNNSKFSDHSNIDSAFGSADTAEKTEMTMFAIIRKGSTDSEKITNESGDNEKLTNESAGETEDYRKIIESSFEFLAKQESLDEKDESLHGNKDLALDILDRKSAIREEKIPDKKNESLDTNIDLMESKEVLFDKKSKSPNTNIELLDRTKLNIQNQSVIDFTPNKTFKFTLNDFKTIFAGMKVVSDATFKKNRSTPVSVTYNAPLQTHGGIGSTEVRKSLKLTTYAVTTEKISDTISTCIETYDFKITIQTESNDYRNIGHRRDVIRRSNKRPNCLKTVIYVGNKVQRTVYSTRLVVEKEINIFVSVLHVTKKRFISVPNYSSKQNELKQHMTPGITVQYFY